MRKVLAWTLALLLGLTPVMTLPALALDGVLYIDADGSTKTVDNVTEVTDDTVGTLSDGWYLFSGSWTRTGTITVSGDVHLILADGCDIKVTGGGAGILVNFGNSLTIYAQPVVVGVGKLAANGNGASAGIGSGGFTNAPSGAVTINGGEISATGGSGHQSGGAGIGGGGRDANGAVIINGGVVTAQGGANTANDSGGGAGIGGGGSNDTNYGGDTIGGGRVTINGGTVTATGGSTGGTSSGGGGAGIGGGGAGINQPGSALTAGHGGTVTITGGIVTATGGNASVASTIAAAAGIGGGSVKINTDFASRTYGGNGAAVTITGGVVTACHGGSDPARGNDIGGGRGYILDNNPGNMGGNGSLSLSGSGSVTLMKGLTVTGTLTVPAGATLTVSSGATLANSGGIIVENGGTLVNNNIIDNKGGGEITVQSGGGFSTLGTIKNTITYDAQGGSIVSAGETGTDGKLASLPAPTKTGYVFDGWFTAATGGTQVTTGMTFYKNTTVYARWTCNHISDNAQAANCLAANVCTICGIEVTPALASHTDSRTSCDDTGTCTACGYIFAAGDHSFTIYTQTVAPDCTTDGEETGTCQRPGCGATDIRPITAPGHTWGAGVETTPATETTPGVTTFTCSVCGETKTEPIPATGGTGGGNGGGGTVDPSDPELDDTLNLNKIGALLKEDKPLTVETDAATVTLDVDALEILAALGLDGTTPVTVTVETVPMKDLTGMQAAQVKGCETVINIDIFVGDMKVDVPITVSIPYTLKANENPAAVCVWHLDDNGNLTKLNGVYNDGYITFTITHQSYFVVGYDPVALWVNVFSDVSVDDPYYDAIAFANYYGLLNGYGNGLSGANDTLSRAQMATLLWNIEGKPSPNGAGRFTDVSNGAWYHNPVIWAVENGIVAGVGGGLFSPDRAVSLQEMAVMLLSYAKFKGYDIPELRDGFTDDAIASWAVTAVTAMTGAGVMGNVNPQDDATRADAAQALMCFLRFVADELPPVGKTGDGGADNNTLLAMLPGKENELDASDNGGDEG